MNRLWYWRLGACLAITALTAVAFVIVSADKSEAAAFDLEPFQFSDDFYIANGIDPTKIVMLPGNCDNGMASSNLVRCDEAAPNSNHSDVRIAQTTVGFRHNGNLLLYLVTGKVFADAFLDQETRDLADNSNAFLFPKASGNPLSPALPNRRQDNIFDTRNGYWANNPMGLWTIVFGQWDGPNVGSSNCADELESLADTNGLSVDGTPVLRTVTEIENLDAQGCLRLRRRAKDGSQGFPWVI